MKISGKYVCRNQRSLSLDDFEYVINEIENVLSKISNENEFHLNFIKTINSNNIIINYNEVELFFSFQEKIYLKFIISDILYSECFTITSQSYLATIELCVYIVPCCSFAKSRYKESLTFEKAILYLADSNSMNFTDIPVLILGIDA